MDMETVNGKISAFVHYFLSDKWSFLSQYCTSFDFRSDALRIFDGDSNTSPMLYMDHYSGYCGDSLPPSQTSSSNKLFFHFYSDERYTGTGFKFEYIAISKNTK